METVKLWSIPIGGRFAPYPEQEPWESIPTGGENVFVLERKGEVFCVARNAREPNDRRKFSLYRDVADVSEKYDENGVLKAPWVIPAKK